MEKLDKVIAGLERHNNVGDGEPCRECPYEEYEMYCLTVMEKDALEMLEKLREENRDLRKDIEVLTEDLTAAREKLSWSEPKPAPNDWGEYPPDFPREGM